MKQMQSAKKSEAMFNFKVAQPWQLLIENIQIFCTINIA